MNIMRRLAIVMIAAPLMMACNGDDTTSVDLTMSSVAGTYTASTAKSGSSLNVTESGFTFNALQQGATITLKLNADGTSTGTLHIPASLSESGADEDTSLAGTWSLSGEHVTLTEAADTFVRDVVFTANGRTLVGTQTSDGTTVNAVLVK